MTFLYFLIPLFLVPFGVAHLFNRVNVLTSRKGFSYFITLVVLGGYSIGFDLINSYFESPHAGFLCRPPSLFLIVLCSPLIVLVQYLFNCAIIKTVKFDTPTTTENTSQDE